MSESRSERAKNTAHGSVNPRGKALFVPEFRSRDADSTDVLNLSEQVFFGWLGVQELELSLPRILGDGQPIPGPPAIARLQRRRTHLECARLRITPAQLESYLASREKTLRAAGVENVSVTCCDGYISVAAGMAEGRNRADVSARIHAVARGLVVEVLASRAYVYGYLPSPMPVVIHRLLAALLDLPTAERRRTRASGAHLPETRGLGQLVLAPLHAFLWSTLPQAGWRLPATDEIELRAVDISSSGIELWYRHPDAGADQEGARPRPGDDIRTLMAENEQLRPADDTLLAGELDSSLRLYRAEMAAGGPDQPHVLERILGVEGIHPAYFTEAADLAWQTLNRYPEMVVAHLVLANLAMVEGDLENAAVHYRNVADIVTDQPHEAVQAAKAAARAWIAVDAGQATAMYERVLAYEPTDRDVQVALLERYLQEGRYLDGAGLLRARIAADADHAIRGELSIRLAAILGEQLGDGAAAIAELQEACREMPDEPRVFEALAAQYRAAGYIDRALDALDRAVELAQQHGDRTAEARVLLTMANADLEAGRLERAEAGYLSALDLDADEPRALIGIATVLGQRGDPGAALDAWRRVTEVKDLSEEEQLHAYLELGRAACALDDRETARHALTEVTRNGEGEAAAEAYAWLAEMHRDHSDHEGALNALDAAVRELSRAADAIFTETAVRDARRDPVHIPPAEGERRDPLGDRDERLEESTRYLGRAAELSLMRAQMLTEIDRPQDARSDYERAFELARRSDPVKARRAARALLADDTERGDTQGQRRWIDILLGLGSSPEERHELLLSRARLLGRDADQIQAALRDIREVLTSTSDESRRAHALNLQAHLMAESGDRVGQAKALSERAELAEDPAERIAIRLDAASAWVRAEDISQAARAASAGLRELDVAEEAGQSVPEELRKRALEEFGELAWRRREWQGVIHAYARLREHGRTDLDIDVSERARYAYRHAMAMDATGERDSAMDCLRELLALGDGVSGDDRVVAWQGLAKIQERQGMLEAAARSLEALASDAALAADPMVETEAWHRAGALYGRAGADVAEVRRCMERALERTPAHLPSLDVLERLETELEDTERLASVLQRKLATANGHRERERALLLRLARLYQRTDQVEEAHRCYSRVLEREPDSRIALRFEAEYAARRGERDRAADSYERLSRELPGDQGVGDANEILQERVLCAQALVGLAAASHARDPDSTEGAQLHERAHSVVQRLLVIAPEHPILTAGARELLAMETSRAEHQRSARTGAARAESGMPPGGVDIETLRENADTASERGDTGAYAAALEALAQAMEAAGPSTRPRQRARRAEVYLELADLFYDRIGDRHRARQAMFSAAESYGSGARRDATLRMLAAEAVADGADREAIRAYERIEPSRQSAADRYNLAACYQRSNLGYRALGVLEEAQESALLTDQAARLMFLVRQELGSARERAAVLEERARYSDNPAAHELLEEALELYEQTLGDLEAASRVQATLVAAGAPSVRDDRKWESNPPPQVSIDADADAPDVLDEVEDSASRTMSAQARLEQLVEAALGAGDEADAAEQLARAVILRTGKLTGDSIPLDEVTGAALERLREMAETAETFEPLVRALSAVARVVDDPVHASALWSEVALLYRERLGSRIRSGEALMQAVAANPGDSMLIHEAEELFGQLGDYPQLADVYELHVNTLEGTELAHSLVVLGRIYLEELDDEPRAAMCYEQAYAADSELPDVWEPLAEIRAHQGDIETANAFYHQLLEIVDESDSRTRIEERIAELDDRLRNSTAEIATPAEETTGSDGPDEPDGMYPPEGSSPEGNASSSAELMARGSILEASGQWDAAVEAYEAAAARRPGDLLPLEAIARLHGDLGEGEALLLVIDRMLERVREPRERARLYRRQAQISRDLLQRDTDSYLYLKQAHEADPENLDIAYSLRATAMARGEWTLAAQLLGREIVRAEDPREAGALHLELALIYDEKLLDVRRARESYERALQLDPDIPAAPRPLARIYELEDRFAEAATMHERAAHTLRNDEQRAHLLHRAAECSERAGQSGQALALYRAVADHAGNDPELREVATSALGRLDGEHTKGPNASEGGRQEYLGQLRDRLDEAMRTGSARTGELARELFEHDPADASAYTVLVADAESCADWATLVEIVQARAQAVATFDEKAAAYHTLGLLYQTRLHDHAAAINAYENALRASPEHPPALESLANIAFEQRDWARAREFYARLSPERTSIGAVVLAYREGLVAEGLGDYEGALRAFSRASKLSPKSPEILAGLSRAAVRTGSLDEAITAARAQLDILPVQNMKVITEARLELANLYQKAGDIDQAIRYNELVLFERPRSQAALRALYTLYLDRRKFDDAARILSTIISMTGSLTRRAELLYSLGELYLEQVSDYERAADAYLKGIDLDPDHVPILRRLIDYYWREDEPEELIDIVHTLVDRAGLLEQETNERTLVRTLLTAAGQGDAGLIDSIAEYLGPRFIDALVAVLIETTQWEGEGPPVQALAENLIATHGVRSDIDIPAIIERLDHERTSEGTGKLVTTLRTLYASRRQSP